MNDPKPPPAPGPEDKPAPSGWRSILDLLKKRATETIVIVFLAGASGAFWVSWSYLEGWIKGFIVQATVEELNKNENRLVEPIKKTLARLRSNEIGALSVGNFALTPSNPQYVLPIYMPKSHSGKLSIMLSGNLVPNQSYVVLMLPNGKKLEIKKDEMTIDLGQLVSMENDSGSGLPEGLVIQSDYVKGLRTLTFQLAGVDSKEIVAGGAADVAKPERTIFVRYLTLISPTINMSNTQ
jgi:hypothetical protein